VLKSQHPHVTFGRCRTTPGTVKKRLVRRFGDQHSAPAISPTTGRRARPKPGLGQQLLASALTHWLISRPECFDRRSESQMRRNSDG
jgi:hypothetical protein